MSQLNTRATIDTLRTQDSSTLTGSYQAFGSIVTHQMRLIKITNDSNKLVFISIDGINDNEVLPASSFLLIDFAANRETGNAWELPANTQFYVKGTAGTGFIYLSVYYAN